MNLEAELKELREDRDGHLLYNAGLPGFPRNFTRDGIISSFLFEDGEMLEGQLGFCAAQIGKHSDPMTGEEPGKIFHEFPGYPMRERLTTYNACDTTSFFLMGVERLERLKPKSSLIVKIEPAIRNALEYIERHFVDGFFIEDPAYSNAPDYALKVTYWKDSHLIGRADGLPLYPCVYPLAHIQAACGVRSAGRVLNDDRLVALSEAMFRTCQSLVDTDTGALYLAQDREGPVKYISSDSLHALWYLEPGDFPHRLVEGLVESAKSLETEAGYLTFSPDEPLGDGNQYHCRTVWPFEQACIHQGAVKFGFNDVAAVAARVVPYLDSAPEILEWEPDKIEKGGCDPQLWTLAAKSYFSRIGIL